MNLRTAAIALLAAVSALALASGQENNAGDDQPFGFDWGSLLFWEVGDSGVVTLPPDGCDSVEIKAAKNQVVQLTVDPVDFPEDCLPEDTIETSSIFSADDMCESWSPFFAAPFKASNDSTALVMTDEDNCLFGSHSFVSLKSTCSKAVKLSYTVKVREMTHEEVSYCDSVADAVGAFLGLGFAVLVFTVILPIVIIIVGITLCCCCCPGCPGYKKKHPTVVLAPVDQYLQAQYPAGYEEHVPLTAGPTSAVVQMK